MITSFAENNSTHLKKTMIKFHTVLFSPIRSPKSIIIICIALSGNLFLSAQAVAKSTPGNSSFALKTNAEQIKPLTIGDTVPDEVYRLLGSAAASSKAMLIDFWEMSCGNCLMALPLFDSLQRQYSDQLMVVTVTSHYSYNRISSFLKKFPRTRNIHLPVITGDSLLRQYFPFELISHVVWISKAGVVQAITGTAQLNRGNIGLLIEDKPLHLPVKSDIPDFDYSAAMLGFSPAGIPAPAPLYYAAVSGRLNGLNGTNAVTTDSISGVTRCSFFNINLLQLCRLALENSTAYIPRKQLVLPAQDTSRFLPDTGAAVTAWKERNTYCYWLQIPQADDQGVQKRLIRENLAGLLKSIYGIKMIKETKLLPCLLLKKDTTIKGVKTAAGGLRFNNLSELLFELNERSKLPWIYNETGIFSLSEIPLFVSPAALESKVQLAIALAPYGIRVDEAMQEQERYFVITNNF
jgi:thiol-disulfide isomerase/thioredoxin